MTHADATCSVESLVTRLADAIAAAHGRDADVVLVGIQRRGVDIARRLMSLLEGRMAATPRFGSLDINFYRDDWTTIQGKPVIGTSSIPGSLEGALVILVDDVLSTGRTIRAALDAITDYGRPELIRLAVLVDRGNPEYPIRADYVGRRLTLPEEHKVAVLFDEDGDEAGIYEVNWKQS